jgi:branched-chain amino acid aminotransferase
MHPHLLHNEEIRPVTDRFLSPGQAGLLNGWGVFSTLRVMDGVLFEWPRHYQRMERDARLLGVPLPASAPLEQQLYRLIAANHAPESTLRVCVVRNTGGPFDASNLTRDHDVIAFTKNLAQWGAHVRLGLVPNGRFAACPFRGTKVLSWSMNLRWYEQARAQGLDEVVLLNEHGHVAELTSANIFAVRGTEILTPPLTSGCLPGITREVLLEVDVPGYRVREADLTPHDLSQAGEVFISSSTRETLPVSHIEGLSLRYIAPDGGPARQAAHHALTTYMRAYAERHRATVAL